MTSDRGPDALTSDQLLEVLANIDLGTVRWRRKVKILGIVGRWGEIHEIGVRELARRSGCGLELTRALVAELIDARALVPLFVGQGSRATAYVVSPAIERWAGVPWERDIDAIARWVFHVEHEQYAEPARRAVLGSRTARRASRRAAGDSRTARRPERRAAELPRTARRQTTARGIGASARAQIDKAPQEGFPPVGGAIDASPTPGGAGGGGEAEAPEWRRVLAAVRAAAKAPFVEGKPKQALYGLYREVGADQILEWLPDAPAGHKVPRLVDWLLEQPHRPPDELLERLADRGDPEPDPTPEPERPTLAEFIAGADPTDRADPAVAADAARRARERLGSTPSSTTDDTMATTGGEACSPTSTART